jgi:N-acetylglutamate synthase-like GNAT family acetyltransferase
MSKAEIVEMTEDNIFDYGFCGTRSIEHEGCRRKAEWFTKRLAEGMRYKVLYSEEKGTIGLIEYIPGKYAWRAIEADKYMVIHCLCIFYKPFREKGYASEMIDECLEDARKEKLHGVAVVTRKGAWMAGKEIFVKKGFEVVDQAPPDFELLVKKFKKDPPDPKFTGNYEKALKKYGKGLTILWSDQCPFIAKAIKEIGEMIEDRYGIEAKMIQINNHEDAQNAPSPYAIFNLIYDGKLLAFHPISSKRFMNIMDKELKKRK